MNNVTKKIVSKVYVLESFDHKAEGNLLREGRDLIKFFEDEMIEYEFHKFTSTKDLKSILATAGGRLFDDQERQGILYMPYLHFICHGNKNGIGAVQKTGESELITWEKLNDNLFSFSYNADMFGGEKLSKTLKRELNLDVFEKSELDKEVFDSIFKQYTYCVTFLILTSCSGGELGFSKLRELNNFSFLIGSQKLTDGNETSKAFQEFYKHFKNQEDFLNVLKKMNSYITEGALEVFISEEMFKSPDELNLLVSKIKK